jgi:hypothetical protein
MKSSLRNSIQRAQGFMGTVEAPTAFIVFKVRPEPSECCCTDCWPEAWQDVNDRIVPSGPVPHEGDAFVEADGGGLVIEGHESGPEFVVLLSVVSGSITVLRTIIDLILLFARKGRRSRRSVHVHLRLIYQYPCQ